jgi:SAM-dependent methyltransferase
MAELYDETRTVDPACFESALDFLTDRFPPCTFPAILYPGIGTGRIAIPLAKRGYRITGVDISARMLERLRDRLHEESQPLPLTFLQADATDMPFHDRGFDLAIAVHLFYFIRRWRKAVREILRALQRPRRLVLMHTGMGAEVPLVNDRYKHLCADEGYPVKAVGVQSTTQVVGYCVGLGCRVEWVRGRWRWVSRTPLDAALAHVRARAYSFTVLTPEGVHARAVERLQSEFTTRFGSLSAEIQVHNEIRFALISLP